MSDRYNAYVCLFGITDSFGVGHILDVAQTEGFGLALDQEKILRSGRSTLYGVFDRRYPPPGVVSALFALGISADWSACQNTPDPVRGLWKTLIDAPTGRVVNGFIREGDDTGKTVLNERSDPLDQHLTEQWPDFRDLLDHKGTGRLIIAQSNHHAMLLKDAEHLYPGSYDAYMRARAMGAQSPSSGYLP